MNTPNSTTEVNFDGLVGPTHSYAGLAEGNIASTRSEGHVSNPRAAFMQGLEKAHMLATRGLVQAVVPPQERPFIPLLRTLGFSGTDEQVIEKVAKEDPVLLYSVCSVSSMWTANAATVAPSMDTDDGRIHIVPASLASKLHRSLEGPTTTRFLRTAFGTMIDNGQAEVHDPLHLHSDLGDEGAANHMRFAATHDVPGTHLFAYGLNNRNPKAPAPQKFAARQTIRASQSLARLSHVPAERVIYAQKNPAAIDAGVFHNDVISTNNQLVWMLHELAYVDTQKVIGDVRAATAGDLSVIMATSDDLSLQEAIDSYVFNVQVVTKPDGTMMIVAPLESRDSERTKAYLDRVVADAGNPVNEVAYLDLKQSMKNGGGPACLRLRVVLSNEQRGALNGRLFLDDALYGDLREWGEKHYRDRLAVSDLADPLLVRESHAALDELTKILQLGSLYDFQKE